jgi:hypothetical protein
MSAIPCVEPSIPAYGIARLPPDFTAHPSPPPPLEPGYFPNRIAKAQYYAIVVKEFLCDFAVKNRNGC